MKKLMVLLMGLVFAVCMTACGDEKAVQESKQESEETVKEETAEEETAEEETAEEETAEESDEEESSQATVDFEIPVYPLNDSFNLSDSVVDGQIAIEGVVYQMPIAVSELVDNGWTYNHGDEELEPAYFGMVQFTKGNVTFSSKVMNDSEEVRSIDQCHVVTIIAGPNTSDVATYYNSDAQLINVQFSSAVNISTTEDELIAALGESESDSFLKWTGDNAKYLNPGVSFSAYYNEDGTLNNFTVEYLPADFQP